MKPEVENILVANCNEVETLQVQDYCPIRTVHMSVYSDIELCMHTPSGQLRILKTVRRSSSRVPPRIPEHKNICPILAKLEQGNHIVVYSHPFYEGGDLTELSGSGKIPDNRAIKLFRQVLSAISCLHDHNIVHRDIKLDNFVLDKDMLTLRLIDFETASTCTRDSYDTTALFTTGTIPYLAPELLASIPEPSIDYKAADMWAAAVMFFAMISGAYPWAAAAEFTPAYIQYAHLHSSETIEGISSLPGWTSLSPTHIFLLSHLLCPNPVKRWTVRQALEYVDTVLLGTTTALDMSSFIEKLVVLETSMPFRLTAVPEVSSVC